MEITTARVVNSTPMELVLLSYEAILDDIDKNIKKINTSIDEKICLNYSKAFIRNLKKALDNKYSLAINLRQIYTYVTGLLITSEIITNRDKIKKNLEETRKIMGKLYDAWQKVYEKDNKEEKMMDNVDAIYSGLTYGRTGLNETVMSRANRGLKA